ncbi:hypothetical protein [Streptomyces cucumeris]|uniref:hypothetical protein n=1 Tax=Streptomyces cucumeris TaxID=2962890 RepID=UPI003D743EFE
MLNAIRGRAPFRRARSRQVHPTVRQGDRPSGRGPGRALEPLGGDGEGNDAVTEWDVRAAIRLTLHAG